MSGEPHELGDESEYNEKMNATAGVLDELFNGADAGPRGPWHGR